MNYKKILSSSESKVSRLFHYFERHFFLALIILFVASLSVRLYLTDYDTVLREESYGYVLKSLEITKGSFVPILNHAIGLSLFMSPFFYFFGSESIFQNMIYARIISNVIGALSIFPLAYIGKKILDKKSLIVLIVLFAFSPGLMIYDTEVFPEPLFIFLFITSVFFIIKAMENQNYILASAAFGGLAYYVRFNGIVILPIILLSFFLLRKQIPKFDYKYLIYIVAVFFAVSAPLMYQRYADFGSPFFHGDSSKYFVDERFKAFGSENIPVPSLMEYLRTHTFTDYLDKFVIHGFLGIIYDYFFYSVSPLVLFFFLYGAARHFNDVRFAPFISIFLIWVMSFIPVWHIYHEARYLYPTIPFILIFSAIGINDVIKDRRYGYILLSLFLIVFVPFSLKASADDLNAYTASDIERDGLEWGRWAAQNIQGKIAIIEGGDLIMMHLPDSAIAGVSLFDIYAPESNLSTVRPGYFENLSSAMVWFNELGVTHLALDDRTIHKRPYLKEVYPGRKIPQYLTEVYSNYNTDSKWKMRIYRINWPEYWKRNDSDKK